MTDGVFYFVRVYLCLFCVYIQASVGMVRHEQDLCVLVNECKGQHEIAFATHFTSEIYLSK